MTRQRGLTIRNTLLQFATKLKLLFNTSGARCTHQENNLINSNTTHEKDTS